MTNSQQTAPTAARNGLSDRMRGYEAITRTVLPPRSWSIVRLDGKSFSAYTRALAKPFDERFAADMDTTALALVADYPGTVLAYVASDEISLVTCDLAGANTQPHLGGVVPKIVSLTAARATATFNAARADLHTDRDLGALPLFDARVFTLPDPGEVINYLAWRLADTRRNALAMMCDSTLGKKATRGKGTAERVAMLADAGVEWDQVDPRHAFGRLVVPASVREPVTYTRRDTGETITTVTDRKRWVVQTAPARFSSGDLLLGLLTIG